MNKNTISKWFSMFVLMMAGTTGATAQSLTVADATLVPGKTKVVSISLDAAEGQTIYGIQTDITLSEGLTIDAVTAANTSLHFDKNTLTNGATRVALLSLGGEAIPAGEVIKLTVKAATSFESGSVSLANSKLTTTATGTEINADATSGLINAYDCFPYQKYIIGNAESSLFWGAGNDWGTQATLVAHPVYVKLDYNEADSTYKLESQVSQNGYYFNGDYMDTNAPLSLTIKKIETPLGYEDDAETKPVYGYTIANGDNYFGWDGTSTILGKNLTATDEKAIWLIMPLDEAKAGLVNATLEEPLDATLLIEDHDFGRNNRNAGFWKMEASNKNLCGGDYTNMCAESWHSNFTLSQTLADAPAGIYALTAQGFYGQDGTDNEHLPVFYANDATKTFPLKTGNEDSMSKASASFSAGLYTIEPLVFELKEGETLTIGAKLEGNTSLWCIWDNFNLTYYGKNTTLEDVEAESLRKEVEALREKATDIYNEVEIESIKTILYDAIYSTGSVSGAEAINNAITTLKAAIAEGELYIEVAASLDAMENQITNTNVYTDEALVTYLGIYDAAKAKYQAGELTKADVIENPEALMGWHAPNQIDDLLLSAWTIGETKCKDYDADLYINTWSNEGEKDGSNFKVPFFEYFATIGNPLPEKTLTATMNGLEPGKYDVTAWVRVAPADKTATSAKGVTLQVNEGDSVNVCTGEQFDCDAERFFIKEYTATGVVAEDSVLKIKFNVAEDNNIHWLSFKNVKFTKKLPTYKVNEVANGTVVRTTEGETELGTDVKVPYRHYNVLEGKLYSKGVTSKEYNYKFKLNADEQVENITYAATDKENIVFLSEGEDIEGLTPCTSGNTGIRSSNSASAYAAEADVAVTKLQAGTYKLTAAIFDASKNPNSMWYFLAGNDTIAKLNCTAVNYQELTSGKFTLENEATIYLAKGGSGSMGLDLVYIQAVEADTPIFAYTVNEMVGDNVVRATTGTGEKDADIKVPFREYNTYEGKLYKKSQISKEFNYSFKLTTDNQVENLTYNEVAGVEDVVFLSEGEDIQGLTPITTGNAAIRSSNSAAAYAAEGDVEIVKLPAGTYKLVAVIYDSSKNPDSHWIFKAGDKEIADLNCTVVNIQELSSEEFTLDAETAISMAKGGSASMGLDLIYIVKVPVVDAISNITTDAQNAAVFNLNGQKMNKTQKGLYIINGKKAVIK